MHPIIRPLQKADNLQVATIIRQVMTEFACVGDGYSIEDPEVNDMYSAYQGANAAFFIIEHEGQVMGCGGFGPLVGGDSTVCELKKMYFLPNLRGMGMGLQLLDHCLTQAKKCGYTKMYLETVTRMVAANSLYRKSGFIPLAGPEGATGHGGCDAFYARIL